MIEPLDWVVIAASLVISLIIGWWAMMKSQGTSESFFLAGRSMPWWLLGVSMVATTFAADTPTFWALDNLCLRAALAEVRGDD
jgi:SSS family solute:Na+ symporter